MLCGIFNFPPLWFEAHSDSDVQASALRRSGRMSKRGRQTKLCMNSLGVALHAMQPRQRLRTGMEWDIRPLKNSSHIR
jgi:hypothetical protein